MRVPIILLLILTLFTASAFGYMSGKMNYKWWKDPRVAEKLNLSEDQVNQIERVFTAYKERIVILHRRFTEEDNKLKNALQNPHSTKEEILKITDDLEEVKASLSKLKIQMYLQVKEILTNEQIKTLHEIKAKYKQRMRNQ